MAHPHLMDIRKAHGDKMYARTGIKGGSEHPSVKAERFADTSDKDVRARSDRTHEAEEQFISAPPRQVSNLGRIRGDK